MQMVVHLFSNILVKLENMVDLILTLVKQGNLLLPKQKTKKKKRKKKKKNNNNNSYNVNKGSISSYG